MGYRDNSTKKQSGDTMIEVAVSIAILGTIMVGAYSVISRNYSGIRNAVINTSARNEVNSQAQLLRYTFDNGHSVAGGATSMIASSELINEASGPNKKTPPSADSCSVDGPFFYLELNSNYDAKSKDYAKSSPIRVVEFHDSSGYNKAIGQKILQSEGGKYFINTASQSKPYPTPQGGGVVIQGYKYPGYIDYYIRACWTERGIGSANSGHLQSVVRVQYGENSVKEVNYK